jgi:hypothetical protein
MSFYSLWLSVPPVAAFVSELLQRRAETRWLPTVTFSLLCSPLLPTALLVAAVSTASPGRSDAGPPDRCMRPGSFETLSRLKPGLVVGDLDLGPFVLAATPSSALSAPYHRMTWGILTNQAILAASGAEAESRARAVGASYVIECRSHARQAGRRGLAADSLQKRLDAGDIPAWLEPMSPAGAPLQIYRLRPQR